MKAIDVMQRDLITAKADMTIDDAIRLMVANRISGLPVVDATGAVVGILSEGDLLRRTELATRVLVENTPGVRAMVDHLIWIDAMSGVPIDPQPWGEAGHPEAPP